MLVPGPVQRLGLAVLQARQLHDLDWILTRQLRGVVGAPVGDHHNAVREPVLGHQGIEGGLDAGRLVVSGDQRRDPGHATRLSAATVTGIGSSAGDSWAESDPEVPAERAWLRST